MVGSGYGAGVDLLGLESPALGHGVAPRVVAATKVRQESRPLKEVFSPGATPRGGTDGIRASWLGRFGWVASVAELLADRYELEVLLGSGGMGDVYRARDRLLERPVAVKVPTTTLTAASAERFKREARAAARLNHPNVVGVYDWGGGTEPFIVMEFVEGRSLRAELKERGHACRRPRWPRSARRSPTRSRTPTTTVSSTAT